MAGAIESVVHTNLDGGASQSVDQGRELESAFGSVLAMAAVQTMERGIENLHEAVAETEEDA
ncbi:hypothetical protein RX327_31245 [Bradyrhizobium sp. BEA-2-5]|uniref:hypothetical protein n=1 Tax=Bradyrhizobium sp. BEA-2-5 TaxID=3080015 RepID=UPI00293E92D1|nr:hypothetical protein [Bradyrhizobium sp. BEA-2-5]WOH80254.1 hypothetical protein RX327_31245 [Bradyrhizobium sp. BEA-2-5]